MKRSGFTLVELIVVIAIIGIVIGLLLPAIQKVRAASYRVKCENNLKQLALAFHGYESNYGEFPPGLYCDYDASIYPKWYGWPWQLHILEYIEQGNIYRRDQIRYKSIRDALLITKDRRGFASTFATSAKVIGNFICPADAYKEKVVLLDWRDYNYADGWFGVCSYLGNGGTYSTYFRDAGMQDDGMLYMTGPDSKPESYQANLEKNAKPVKMLQVYDGTSNTLLLGERYHFDPNFDRIHHNHPTKFSRYPIAKWGVWAWTGGGTGTPHILGSSRVRVNYTTPANDPPSYSGVNLRMSAFGSGHPGGANFAMTDGSVRFLTDDVNPVLYSGMSTRAGND